MVWPQRDIPMCTLLFIYCSVSLTWTDKAPICPRRRVYLHRPPLARVVSGLSSSWHCAGITYRFANSSNSQSYLCIGDGSFQWKHTLPLALSLLVSIGRALSHPDLQDVTAPITGRSDGAADVFVRWRLWKHACFSLPSHWHRSWLFACVWAVISLHRQTDGLCDACQEYWTHSGQHLHPLLIVMRSVSV